AMVSRRRPRSGSHQGGSHMKVTVFVALAAGGTVALSSAPAGPPPAPRLPRAPFRVVNNAADTLPYADNFDSYATGAFPCSSAAPNCAGPNDWHLWASGEARRGGPRRPQQRRHRLRHRPLRIQRAPLLADDRR